MSNVVPKAEADRRKAEIIRTSNPVTKYSKYKIQLAAQRLGVWENLKTAISEMNLADSWANIQDISSDNEELKTALPLVKQAFPSIDVDAVLAECVAQE